MRRGATALPRDGDTRTRGGGEGAVLSLRRTAAPTYRPVNLALGLASVVGLGVLFLMLAQTAFADPLDDRARAIAKQLQCPVCQSVSVADSPSELAGQMRDLIRAKLAEGWTDEQIIQYFVDRYGDQVLLEPPRRGLSLAVWWAPVIILTGGGALLLALLRSWLRTARPPRARAATAAPSLIETLSDAQAIEGPAAGQQAAPNGAVRASNQTYEEQARLELEQFRREVDP